MKREWGREREEKVQRGSSNNTDTPIGGGSQRDETDIQKRTERGDEGSPNCV